MRRTYFFSTEAQLGALRRSATPVFGSDIGDRLAEGPAMTAEIFGDVLPFAVWEVAGGIEDSGAVCARLVVVGVDVFDAHHHGVGHRTRLRHRAAVAVGGHHDERRVADPELR